MKHKLATASLEAHFHIKQSELFQLYLRVTQEHPKSRNISNSLYVTCLSLQILEAIGIDMPTQLEIDCIESFLRRFNKRKPTQIKFQDSPNAKVYNVTSHNFLTTDGVLS